MATTRTFGKVCATGALVAWLAGCQASPVASLPPAVAPAMVFDLASNVPAVPLPLADLTSDANSRQLQQAASIGAPGAFAPWYLSLAKNGVVIDDLNGTDADDDGSDADDGDDTDADVAPNHMAYCSHAVSLLPKLDGTDKSTRLLVHVPEDTYLFVAGVQARAIPLRRMLVNNQFMQKARGPRTDRMLIFAPGEDVVFTYVRLPKRFGTFFGYFMPVAFGLPK